jgi:hypothetical protein
MDSRYPRTPAAAMRQVAIGRANSLTLALVRACSSEVVHSPSEVLSLAAAIRCRPVGVPLGRGIGTPGAQALGQRDDLRCGRRAPLLLCGCGIGRCSCAASAARRSLCMCRRGERLGGYCVTGRGIRHRVQDLRASPIPRSGPRQRQNHCSSRCRRPRSAATVNNEGRRVQERCGASVRQAIAAPSLLALSRRARGH